ncbi:hypothetical protein T4D_3398 [Trichinella pseudospiralis]|uniref:Uncharacterized protein n=1 Tax=Trichinella pseudospiralis TaxID=6337 RepID=A0A0V1FT38_TRIPS|nr:hypothetical protein T4D_3398 [Trichinella pseudospiralis]
MGQQKFHFSKTNRRRHSVANGIWVMGHINLHIIKYGNFVGKILLEMQVAFLIDVVIATDNIVKYSAFSNYKSQEFNIYYKQRRKQYYNDKHILLLSILSYEPLRLPFVILSLNVK